MNKLLQSIIEIADIHATRIETAMTHIKPLLPITSEKLINLSDENLGFLELLTSRFAKLQDLIGAKLFPQILVCLQDDSDTQSNLDRLHKLEKIGLLPSVKDWTYMRIIRNSITHEYPDNPALTCENLTKTIKQASNLLEYWVFLKAKIISLDS